MKPLPITLALVLLAYGAPAWSLSIDAAFQRVSAQSFTGVTVLTHGFTVNDGGDYLVPMGQAIRERLLTQSSDPVWLLDYDLTNDGLQASFNDGNTVLPPIGAAGLSGHAVLVFDWAPESNEDSRWWAEAAGDALFALGTGLGLFDPASGQAPPVQFIGHSFGTVVTTEAVERLAAYGVEVDQVTLLDPHDFDQAGVPIYDGAQAMYQLGAPAGYGATIWDNVVESDVYYQTRGFQDFYSSLATANPEGRPIPGAYNRLLDGSDELPAGNPYGGIFNFEIDSDHSYIQHTFYTGTILGGLPPGADPPAAPTDYNATGWAHSVHNANRVPMPAAKFYTPAQDHEHTDDVLANPDGTPNGAGLASLGLTSQEIDNARWAPEFSPGDIVNGDFESGSRQDLSVDIVAGWSHHGGGGDSEILSESGNRYLQLDSNDLSRTHNLTYIPTHAASLLFDFRVVDPSIDDRLEILIGSTLLDSLPLAGALGWVSQSLLVPTAMTETVQTITLRLTIGASTVDLDNFRFAIAALPGDYNQDGMVDAADYAAWRNAQGAAAGALPNDIAGGPIGAAQYATWRAHYGQSLAFGEGAIPLATPSPGSTSLIPLASLFFWRRRCG